LKIHFIGIGGEGMCGVAQLALAQGHQITGSEIAAKRNLEELKSSKITIFKSHSPDNIKQVRLVVRSSGILMNHVEVISAQQKGITILKRSECLGMLLKDSGKYIISVAGSHGKSTTTTMLGRILEEAELDPTVIVGAEAPCFNGHVRIGKGKFIVVEACEFDRSFLDIGGNSAIITSIEEDHLDYYQGGLSEIINTFSIFSELITDNIILCADNFAMLLSDRYKRKYTTYGLKGGFWRAEFSNSSENGRYSFNVFQGCHFFGTFTIPIAGLHIIQNALGAIVMSVSSTPFFRHFV